MIVILQDVLSDRPPYAPLQNVWIVRENVAKVEFGYTLKKVGDCEVGGKPFASFVSENGVFAVSDLNVVREMGARKIIGRTVLQKGETITSRFFTFLPDRFREVPDVRMYVNIPCLSSDGDTRVTTFRLLPAIDVPYPTGAAGKTPPQP